MKQGRASTFAAGREPERRARSRVGARSAFTLIELILVMAILTIAISFTAPALANFFRGRSLDSEARRLLSLTRQGQSRAVSEGVPVDLWIDANKNAVGLEADASYEETDPRRVEFEIAPEMQLVAIDGSKAAVARFGASLRRNSASAVTPRNLSRRPELPAIRFLPDGTIGDSSVETVGLTREDGSSLWLVLSRNGMQYEIRTRNEPN